MKDLDFDELDKAVNSLMAGVPKTPEVANEQEKTLTISSVEQPPSSVATPAITPSAPSVQASSASAPPASSATPVSRPVAAPASRRAGRFMDVVRPQAPKKQETPAKVSRQGVSLNPPTPNSESASSASVIDPSSAVEGSEKPKETTQSDWPDPLDVSGFSKSSAATMDDSKSDSTPVISETDAAESSLSSPFLPDTKVEKRPLGANAVAGAGITEPTELKPAEEIDESATDEQLPAKLEDTKPLLPEELHSDLIAIESDTTSPEKKESPSPEISEPWKTLDEPRESRNEIPTPEPSKPSIPISIPQQYKEEVSTGEKENGAIYDTDTYHKPLAHPAKQKSGWMWVVWILLILIVGAGGGAALYFLRLV